MLARNSMNFGMGETERKNGSEYDGAIFLCNHLTRKECFEKKLFGLSPFFSDFVQKVKAGATLFMYDVSQRKLNGVFEATSDGAVNIIPDAYISSGKLYPSQIRFKRIWFCRPLMESEFQDTVQNFFMIRNEFGHHRPYGLSFQQVVKLLHLFCSRNRLQHCPSPSLHDELPKDSEVSSLANQIDTQSSPNSSSHGSFKSPCQTCSFSNLGELAVSLSHKLTNPVPVMHRKLPSHISDLGKSNSSRSSLLTGANVDIITISGSHEMMDDKSTDDYIPLLPSVDDLSDLLEDESHSSDSEGSSASEEHSIFYRTYDGKEDECYPPVAISKFRSDSEGRTSVFSRLMGKPKVFSQNNKSKTKPLPSKNAQFCKSLSQRMKKWRTQCKKLWPHDNDDIANRLSRVTALDYSFVQGGNIDKISAKSSGGKQSIKLRLGPFICEYANKDACTKEPGRYDVCKKLFVPEGSRKRIESYDRELNAALLFSGVHESNEVHAKVQIGTLVLESMQCAKYPNIGGDQDWGNEDVEESAGKKMRLASASFPQGEYPSDSALVPQRTKAMHTLASDGNCEDKSTTLSSKDTCTHMARAHLGTKVLLQDEQEQSTQVCSEVIGDASLVLEDSETKDLLPKHSSGDSETCLDTETGSKVASGHLEIETACYDKQNQGIGSCQGVVNTDEMSDHGEDCGSKRGRSFDEN